MVDFQKIKNEKLREELKKSRKFREMKDKEKQDSIDELVSLPKNEQEEFVKFIVGENAVEEKTLKRSKTDQAKMLQQFIAEIQEMAARFKKLANEDKENVQKEKDSATENKLLDDLNKL